MRRRVDWPPLRVLSAYFGMDWRKNTFIMYDYMLPPIWLIFMVVFVHFFFLLSFWLSNKTTDKQNWNLWTGYKFLQIKTSQVFFCIFLKYRYANQNLEYVNIEYVNF